MNYQKLKNDLSIDLESVSSVSDSDNFEVLMVAYALEGQPVKVFDLMPDNNLQ